MITELNNIKFATRLLTAITYSATIKLNQSGKPQPSQSTINSLGPTFAIMQLLQEIINSQRLKITTVGLAEDEQNILAAADSAIAAAKKQQEKYKPPKGSNITLPKDNPHLKSIKRALASNSKSDMRNVLSQFIFTQMNYLQTTSLTNLLLIDTIITANPAEIPQNLLSQYQKLEAQYRNAFSNQLIHTMVELFINIKPEDLLNNSVTAKIFSDCYNKLTSRITWHVIRIGDIHTRTLFMDRLIKVASQLKNQGYYAPYASIMAGLHNVSVSILKKTIAGLSEESKAAYDSYLTESSSVEAQKNYCKQMEERSKKMPVLPDLPSYSNMLGAISEGGKVCKLSVDEDQSIVQEALSQCREQFSQQQDPAATSSDEDIKNTDVFKKIRVRLTKLYLQKKMVDIIVAFQQGLSTVQLTLSDAKLKGSLLTPRELTRDMFSPEEMTVIVKEAADSHQSLAVSVQYYVDEKVYALAKTTDEKRNPDLPPSKIVQQLSHAISNHKTESHLKEDKGNTAQLTASIQKPSAKNNTSRVDTNKSGSRVKGKKRASRVEERDAQRNPLNIFPVQFDTTPSIKEKQPAWIQSGSMTSVNKASSQPVSPSSHNLELTAKASKRVDPVTTDYVLVATRKTVAQRIHKIEREIDPKKAANLAKQCLAKNTLGAITPHQDHRKALIEDPDKTSLDKLVNMASAPSMKGKKLRNVFITTDFFNSRYWQGRGLSIHQKSTLRKQRHQYARMLGITLADFSAKNENYEIDLSDFSHSTERPQEFTTIIDVSANRFELDSGSNASTSPVTLTPISAGAVSPIGLTDTTNTDASLIELEPITHASTKPNKFAVISGDADRPISLTALTDVAESSVKSTAFTDVAVSPTVQSNSDNNQQSLFASIPSAVSIWCRNTYTGIKQFFGNAIEIFMGWFGSDFNADRREVDGKIYALTPMTQPNSPTNADLLSKKETNATHHSTHLSTINHINERLVRIMVHVDQVLDSDEQLTDQQLKQWRETLQSLRRRSQTCKPQGWDKLEIFIDGLDSALHADMPIQQNSDNKKPIAADYEILRQKARDKIRAEKTRMKLEWEQLVPQLKPTF